jgi:hypothetical protein
MFAQIDHQAHLIWIHTTRNALGQKGLGLIL